jgi:cytochrome c
MAVMKRYQTLILILLLFVPNLSAAEDVGTRQEAMDMVRRVKALAGSEGLQAAVEAINSQRPEFKIKDLYPFIYTLEGISVAHGANVKMVGKSWITTKDQDGNYLIQTMVATASNPEGSGWVNYKWPHPITHKVQDKSAYIEKLGEDYFVGVGIYSGL